MTMNDIKESLAAGVSLVLVAVSLCGYLNGDAASGTDAGGAYDGAPMSASELQALVAPIALYPDALVAQILAASTFPDQVAVADYWLHQNQHLTGTSLMQTVDKQSWDSSVKALTEFPSVLDNLAKNLTWTSSLGTAYHDQPSKVMAAIQTLRAEAKAEGNLKSTSEITVVQQTPQTIVIERANPQVVYVPTYNPATIYGTPYVVPGYTAADVPAAGVIGFGAGVALGALAGGGCCGWGWNSWNCNWHGGAVVYNHNDFYGNAAWHGGYYNGGYHDGYGYHNAYNRTGANNFTGSANRVDNFNREEARNLNASHADSWAGDDRAFGRSNAFSGFGDRFGGLGGWASRANSFRGWGSMRAGGFGGGRFGGGGFGAATSAASTAGFGVRWADWEDVYDGLDFASDSAAVRDARRTRLVRQAGQAYGAEDCSEDLRIAVRCRRCAAGGRSVRRSECYPRDVWPGWTGSSVHRGRGTGRRKSAGFR